MRVFLTKFNTLMKIVIYIKNTDRKKCGACYVTVTKDVSFCNYGYKEHVFFHLNSLFQTQS